jgi:hypothetical protein
MDGRTDDARLPMTKAHSAKNKSLVYDHPMNISAKFDSNLFCGFRKKNENVKFP